MPAINERHSKIVVDLWREQPGTYFFLGSKIAGSARGTGFRNHPFVRDGKRFVLADDTPDAGIELTAFLELYSNRDLYFCPHGFSKPLRQAVCAVPGRLFYADLDAIDPRQLDEWLRPTIAWETSPGRYHGIWFADGDATNELNQRLTYETKADKNGWILTKVLRIPGTRNYKPEYDKPIVKVVMFNQMHTIDVKEFDRRLVQLAAGLKNRNSETTIDAAELFKKYAKALPKSTLAELMRKTDPEVGNRSDVAFKLVAEMLEAGVLPDDAYAMIQASKWNKWAGRSDEEDQIQRTIDNVLKKKLANGNGLKKLKKQIFTQVDSSDPEPDGEEFDLGIVRLDQVKEEIIDWLWQPYFARGEITILEGDPSMGKSFVAQMASKAFIDGDVLPTPPGPVGFKKFVGTVLYFDCENRAAYVTVPRMRWAGCKNLNRFLQAEKAFTLDNEAAIMAVHKACQQYKPDFVVFDTLNTYIGGADTYKAGEARQAFQPFLDVAQMYNASVCILRHLTKGKGPAMYRGQGSIALSGTARVVLTTAAVPQDRIEEVCSDYDAEMKTRVRALAVTKLNIGAVPDALVYSIRKAPTKLDPNAGRFTWHDYLDMDSDELLSHSETPKERDTEAPRENAKDFILDALKNGGIDGAALRTMSETRSITGTTFQRASAALEEAGLLLKPKRGRWELTPAGMKAASASKA